MQSNNWDDRRCRILYVQDSAPNRQLVEQVLKDDAHGDVGFMGVCCTPDAMAAIYQSPCKPPNLILLGWSPWGDTLDVLHGVKQDPKMQAVPVLVLGSNMRPQDIQRMYAEFACCVIPLPETLADLEPVFGAIKDLWLSKARLPEVV
jgi:CheY-like chemotaxis protein